MVGMVGMVSGVKLYSISNTLQSGSLRYSCVKSASFVTTNLKVWIYTVHTGCSKFLSATNLHCVVSAM